MNKVIAAVGTAFVSAVSVQAQFGIGLAQGQLNPLETSKPWALSASVRGFYDDNYLTLPKTYEVSYSDGKTTINHPYGSWGTDLSLAAAGNHTGENTFVSASYMYDLQWYADRVPQESDYTLFQTHQFNGHFEHEFSDRYKLALAESFAIAQEPDVLTASTGPVGGLVSSPLRVSGNNVRNSGQADFTASLTKLVDLHLGYGNTVYAYQQIDRSVFGYPFGAGPGNVNGNFTPIPSYSDLLDRMEQLATVDLRWKATPETTGIFGYQYGHTDYTSPGYIIYPDSRSPEGGLPPGSGPYYLPYYTNGPANKLGYRSNIRNSDSHFGFVGADESFTPELNGSLRVGAEYLDYYNYHTSRLSPYVDANLTDQYLPGDSAQIGVKHVHNATDVTGFVGTTPVLDEESTAVYLADSHRITERLTATLMGQAQLSTFVGGGPLFDGKMDQFFILSINFAYHFNPWLSTEAGYNYSKLNSDLQNRSYTRDVMYLGFRAVY